MPSPTQAVVADIPIAGIPVGTFDGPLTTPWGPAGALSEQGPTLHQVGPGTGKEQTVSRVVPTYPVLQPRRRLGRDDGSLSWTLNSALAATRQGSSESRSGQGGSHRQARSAPRGSWTKRAGNVRHACGPTCRIDSSPPLSPALPLPAPLHLITSHFVAHVP